MLLKVELPAAKLIIKWLPIVITHSDITDEYRVCDKCFKNAWQIKIFIFQVFGKRCAPNRV